MSRERILITVKTYPTLSRKYGETVCTAGVREDGSWVRLYPVPFRRLHEEEQYKKYDWVECDVVRSKKDPRPETHHPVDMKQMVTAGHVGTSDNWHTRRKLLLQQAKVYTRLQTLIDGAKSNQISLAIFKPTKVRAFIWEEEEERQWNPTKIAEMRARVDQGDLFSEEAWRESFSLVPKLPYSFSYRFEDEAGKASELQVLDWEAGALYWNCLRRCHNNEKQALEKVREKYFGDFTRKDLHFFLGTTQEYHFRAPNPWVIIGVLPIPYEDQMHLL
ncbi:hypothetical protein [Verrucomicrobium sp. BvORR106]|uniref:hypothetical protein n=1 Tax=Verrucomicrobium sp. BvORR106 TaxID=1403819 RepID=UPI00057079D9|nr:hypothetical protein [Verrucomicrobium sp. BvORR106]